MTPNVWKMFTNPLSTLTFSPYLSWLNNLFMSNFQLTRMSSYAKNKLQMCSVTQHQCRRRQMCGKCSHIKSLRSHLDRYKNDLSSLNNLFMERFLLNKMSTYVKNKLQMGSVTNISVDVAKCVENVHKFIQFSNFLSVTKNDLSWLNNLFMARFQLITMSTYVKSKLQMCSVTQHQCRRRQMCAKCSQIHLVHSLFVRYKKRLVQIEQSIHGKVSTHYDVHLC